MAWNKTKMRNQEKMLSSILKNQMIIMQVIQSQLSTYEHTSRYGKYYIDKLGQGINETANILHMPRKINRKNCPYKTWHGSCFGMHVLCDAVNDEECSLNK